jgi:two-component system chemotaxis response regulator CheB
VEAVSEADVNGVVCIGTSWGGLHALRVMLGTLPPRIGAPICIVQHRGEEGGLDEGLVRAIRAASSLEVCEPNDKHQLEDGHAYVAPPGYHLLVEDDHVALSVDERESYARPSIDVMFESAAESWGPRTIAVVLTGANNDGARGALAVREAGGFVIAQDPDEAERAEMPRAAIEAGAVHEVLPLEAIADAVVRRVRENGAT